MLGSLVVTYLHSPNYTSGRVYPIDRIIFHTMESNFNQGINWVSNPKSKVSAHYAVSYKGDVVQMVNDNDVAWHAGNREINHRSIGIECEGWADFDKWTTVQMRTLVELTASICYIYNIPVDRKHLLAHSEISNQRRDPGQYFRWEYLLGRVKHQHLFPDFPFRGDALV